MQHDQADCGIACLLSIVRFYNTNQSIEKLRELSGTQKTGTTLLGLYQCAKKLGFDTRGVEINIEYLNQQMYPCILHVLMEGNQQHYVVYYGRKTSAEAGEKDIYLIGNPGIGIVELNKESLDAIWETKNALLLQANEKLMVHNAPVNKWKWFKGVVSPDINILVISIVLGLFITILGLSTAIFYQKLIDDILPHAKLNKLIMGISLLFFILVSKSGLIYIRQQFILMQSKAFNERINGNFLNALFFLPKSFFDHRKTGDMTARLNDTQRIQKNIAYITGTVCIDIIVIALTLVVLFIYSTTVAWLSVFYIPIITFTVLAFVKHIKAGQQKVMVAYANTESNYVDHIQGISTIKENNSESFFVNINKAIFRQYQEATISLGNVGNRFTVASELLGVVMLVSILVLSSYLVINKQLKVGEMVAILSMVGSLLPSVHRLAQSNLQIQEAKVAFDRMFEFASIKSEFEFKEVEAIETQEFYNLKVQYLSFGFPGRGLILKDISFQVNMGELIVLLGESGCGKSTILQLLNRFYEPTGGDIYFNDFNINNLYIPNYRKLIATVPQDIKLFNGSLIENITLNKNLDSPDEVHQFCKEYGFNQYFSAFPQGYLTILGEEGINLSGGQKQLVAIARALYKKPKILLLDEATSAMDRHTEQFILSLLLRLKKEMAVVMVTHRINTVKHADHIYIIENGDIIDQGTHESLLMTDNLYSYTLSEYGV